MRLVSYLRDGRPVAGWADETDTVFDAGELLLGEPGVPMRRVLELPDGISRLVAPGSGRDAARVGALDEVTLGAPVPDPALIMAAGMNYAAHIREVGIPAPEGMPGFFAKLPSAIGGPRDDIRRFVDAGAHLDYEAELAAVVGADGALVPGTDVRIAGLTVADDVSMRDLQIDRGQLTLGKGLDTFCPTGPGILPTRELADLTRPRRIWSTVNGEPRQSSTTGDMVFDVPAIVRILAGLVTLRPGDLILTGSPQGVGMGLRPPRWLTAGDVVECGVEGIGTIRNRVISDEEASRHGR